MKVKTAASHTGPLRNPTKDSKTQEKPSSPAIFRISSPADWNVGIKCPVPFVNCVPFPWRQSYNKSRTIGKSVSRTISKWLCCEAVWGGDGGKFDQIVNEK